MRNALAHAPKTQRRMVSAAIATVFAQETAANAHEQWRLVADQLRSKFPKIGALMDSAEHEVLAYMDFPRAHWLQIHSTNPLERQNAAESSGAPMSWASSPTSAPSRAWWAPSCSSKTTSGPCSADTCSLRACSPSAILHSLGCLLCRAETRVHLGPSGLWTYTTRWDTTPGPGRGDGFARVHAARAGSSTRWRCIDPRRPAWARCAPAACRQSAARWPRTGSAHARLASGRDRAPGAPPGACHRPSRGPGGPSSAAGCVR